MHLKVILINILICLTIKHCWSKIIKFRLHYNNNKNSFKVSETISSRFIACRQVSMLQTFLSFAIRKIQLRCYFTHLYYTYLNKVLRVKSSGRTLRIAGLKWVWLPMLQEKMHTMSWWRKAKNLRKSFSQNATWKSTLATFSRVSTSHAWKLRTARCQCYKYLYFCFMAIVPPHSKIGRIFEKVFVYSCIRPIIHTRIEYKY